MSKATDIQARGFDRTRDMAMVASWWKQRGDSGVPVAALPQIGIVVTGVLEGERRDLAVGWMYQTDSAICWIEWVVADPEIPWSQRPTAVEYLIDRLLAEGRRRGFLVAFLSTRHERLIEKAVKCGFNVDEAATMTLLTCNLQGG